MSAGDAAWAMERDAWLRVGELHTEPNRAYAEEDRRLLREMKARQDGAACPRPDAAQCRKEEHLRELIGCTGRTAWW